MTNFCSFEMMVRGKKVDCFKFLSMDSQVYDWSIIDKEGTDEDYMLYVKGECLWNVACSLIYYEKDGGFVVDNGTLESKTIKDKTEILDLEVEIFGYDCSDPEGWYEHYHYNKGREIETGYYAKALCDLYDEDLAEFISKYASKYDYIDEYDVYILKDEIADYVYWDYDRGEMVCTFSMSFSQLGGQYE